MRAEFVPCAVLLTIVDGVVRNPLGHSPMAAKACWPGASCPTLALPTSPAADTHPSPMPPPPPTGPRRRCRFRRNFQASGKAWVSVPRVYWQYSSPSVLTLEYLPGIKITDATRITAAGGPA